MQTTEHHAADAFQALRLHPWTVHDDVPAGHVGHSSGSLLAAEIRWMAMYSPHLDFSLALDRAEADAGSIRCSKDRGVGE